MPKDWSFALFHRARFQGRDGYEQQQEDEAAHDAAVGEWIARRKAAQAKKLKPRRKRAHSRRKP